MNSESSQDPTRCDRCSRPGTIKVRGEDGEVLFRLCDQHVADVLGLKPKSWLATSTDRLGRAVFGALSLLCAIAFGGAVYLLFVKAQPQGVWKQLLWHVLADGFLVLSAFMLLVTAHFWNIGGRLTATLLKKLRVKAGICLAAFVIFVTVTALVHEVFKR